MEKIKSLLIGTAFITLGIGEFASAERAWIPIETHSCEGSRYSVKTGALVDTIWAGITYYIAEDNQQPLFRTSYEERRADGYKPGTMFNDLSGLESDWRNLPAEQTFSRSDDPGPNPVYPTKIVSVGIAGGALKYEVTFEAHDFPDQQNRKGILACVKKVTPSDCPTKPVESYIALLGLIRNSSDPKLTSTLTNVRDLIAVQARAASCK